MTRCVALLSGGLDSMLAIRLMQDQGIEVEGINFKTIFTCCQDQAGKAARELGIRVSVVGQDEDYLEIVRKPRFGYGRGANPCVDCRIYMFQKARVFMEQCRAEFIVSGEIVGQRPKSQKRRDLDTIAYHSDLQELLLRPLSAKLLPPTRPERDGIVDREKLYDFSGRSRKGLIQLAEQFGFRDIPAPSTGCALTEPRFSRKVYDILDHTRENDLWQFDLLKYGRHFRPDARTKIVVGRNEADNESLRYMHQTRDHRDATLISSIGFPAPRVLVVGPATDSTLQVAQALMLRYANRESKHRQVEIDQRGTVRRQELKTTAGVGHLETLATLEE